MHLEAAHVGTPREARAIAPEAAEAFTVLQRGRAGEACLVQRKIAVTGHVVEKDRVVEQRTVEAGDAMELGAREARDPGKPGTIKTGIAQEVR